ncbi:dihydroxyacetone kinase family protein [Streptomyces jeddahensis]|uniref:PTS-dependent dihydroxyacetone kinase, dihydroxyacetone-binding subunit DhaK n=1 Tax=Streptomyces jeddahensis TaxID=1716141 RepID=A0A177HV46_9ACTN|nr:dihydroxyacetone kinase family protein [Streptomyces jeddahensis]OAH14008.1 PTS-dependent dihydroxyacetone kinase, dihydroxyacetone-binding subunit DhaK [Streptomyces jeddahensis]
MTLLHNDPRSFADEALSGFAAAHHDLVRAIDGGVVRASATPPGQVAVVLGGGTGHYPAFAGWVGPGFAHGAACGNIFASPSASQICSVARASQAGGGVIFAFGNYAGDVLHFGQAAEQLRAEGIDVRVLRVTDDIASGPADDPALRRGIAGDLPVMKILGAAAEAGLGIDEAERIGRKANDATRSLGMAFSGCTLPGADHPLFTVAPGRMGVGLGIHGEPGIDERDLPSADTVADLLVDGVLAESKRASAAVGNADRVAVLLNGLGATKYEELYVVFRRVAERLAREGFHVIAPEVGEQVTSLGMAGLSLTVTFLDDELRQLWTAPALTPAFRRGLVQPRPPRTDDISGTHQLPPVVRGGDASRAAAACIAAALRIVRDTVTTHETRLGDIDAVAGDGDHGIGMRRGSEAAADAAAEAVALGAGARSTLSRAGAAWSERAGGTSGALWGAALTAFGSALDDTEPADRGRLVAGVRAAVDAVLRLGGARLGDKTLVDAAVPFVDRLEAALPGTDFGSAWVEAAEAATEAAEATATIAARRGRARTHGERSLGTPDAGAVSFALIVTALGDFIRPHSS